QRPVATTAAPLTVARDGCPPPRPKSPRTRKMPASRPFLQADDGSRTRDLRLGKPTLYRLSYVRAVLCPCKSVALSLAGGRRAQPILDLPRGAHARLPQR